MCASILVNALGVIAVDFLDPLQVGDRHDTDQEIGEGRHVVALTLHTAMKAFVEEQVSP